MMALIDYIFFYRRFYSWNKSKAGCGTDDEFSGQRAPLASGKKGAELMQKAPIGKLR
jgi:hypothetical protein